MLARPVLRCCLRRDLRPLPLGVPGALPSLRSACDSGLQILLRVWDSPPFRTHAAARARGCPRPAPSRVRCFARSRSHPAACCAPLPWFLATSAVWGLRHPRACCSPISDPRFTAFLLRQPLAHRGTEAPGRRWGTGEAPRCVPTLRRLAPRRQPQRLTTLLCPLAVHRSGGPDEPFDGLTPQRSAPPSFRIHLVDHPMAPVAGRPEAALSVASRHFVPLAAGFCCRHRRLTMTSTPHPHQPKLGGDGHRRCLVRCRTWRSSFHDASKHPLTRATEGISSFDNRNTASLLQEPPEGDPSCTSFRPPRHSSRDDLPHSTPSPPRRSPRHALPASQRRYAPRCKGPDARPTGCL